MKVNRQNYQFYVNQIGFGVGKQEKSKDFQVKMLFINVKYTTGFGGQFMEDLDMVKLTLLKGSYTVSSLEIRIWCCRKE